MLKFSGETVFPFQPPEGAPQVSSTGKNGFFPDYPPVRPAMRPSASLQVLPEVSAIRNPEHNDLMGDGPCRFRHGLNGPLADFV